MASRDMQHFQCDIALKLSTGRSNETQNFMLKFWLPSCTVVNNAALEEGPLADFSSPFQSSLEEPSHQGAMVRLTSEE